jgi:hypothetical protein
MMVRLVRTTDVPIWRHGMDIERADSDSEVIPKNDRTLDRRIIPCDTAHDDHGQMSSRRRWSVDEKLAIVEASYDPGSTVQEVVHCFEVSPAQIYSWRKQAAEEDSKLHDKIM